MVEQKYADIVTPELLAGAIENNEYHGFLQDYHVLHCLLKAYKPKSVFEVGTNMGRGTKIIKNAVGPEAKVFSLDLPTELAHISLQHPINEGHGDRVGHLCDLPFTQLRGDSMEFDYSKYPCEACFIDGEHDFDHPCHETSEIVKTKPKLMVWHDSDISVVYDAITKAMKGKPYELFRVTDTRIAYAVRK
jgi:predicted O-methyltransferase YrrM